MPFLPYVLFYVRIRVSGGLFNRRATAFFGVKLCPQRDPAFPCPFLFLLRVRRLRAMSFPDHLLGVEVTKTLLDYHISTLGTLVLRKVASNLRPFDLPSGYCTQRG